MFDKEVYIARRKRLKEQVGNGMILFLGNEESSMNYRDNLYPFRQDSTFLYFFGIDRPGLVALIDVDNDKDILFGDDFTTEEMVWTGYKEPLHLIAGRVGITEIKKKNQLESEISEAILKKRKIHFLPPYRPEHFTTIHHLLAIDPMIMPQLASVDLIRAIVDQRSFKSPEELEEITKAVNTTIDMQLYAMKTAKEGMTEAQIAGALQGIAIAAGGNLSFPTILTMQGQILHNGYSYAILKEGNMVLCDCGAETEMHYAGDLTRTFPVAKKLTSIQQDIYSIVLNAHQSAVSLLKPGILFRDVHLFACEKLTEGLQQLGLMRGDIKESVEMGAHALFFPCGLGHMMGLDTHDMENLGEQYVGYNDSIKKSTQFGLKSLRLGKPLEQGFVITVEPGLYFNPDLMDEWAADKHLAEFINYEKLAGFRNVNGFRVEEDFLITSGGSLLLGKPLAKTAEAIEELRA
ncbi:MAG TPA: Xaa-Pro aminopeptidase [Chitinophagaceae bacterium]|nr:Xaa-Pro aminopeptidase [Chitinophagaceae bacterium]